MCGELNSRANSTLREKKKTETENIITSILMFLSQRPTTAICNLTAYLYN